MKLIVCVILLVYMLGAVGEEHFGTMVVSQSMDKEILISADSRESVRHKDGSVSHADDKCKIVTLSGKFVFSATGDTGMDTDYPGRAWDMQTFAKDSAKRIGKAASLRDIALNWEKSVLAAENRDLKVGVSGPNGRGTGIFFGFDDGKPEVYVVETFKEGNSYLGESPILNKGKTSCLGICDIWTEVETPDGGPLTARAQRWWKDFYKINPQPSAPENSERISLTFAKWVIEMTSKYSEHKEDVGGPVDIVKLDSSGPHWVDVKTKCK